MNPTCDDDERAAAYRLADEIAEEIADEDRRREDNPEDFAERESA